MIPLFIFLHNIRVADELWKGVCSVLKVGRLAKKSPIANNDFRSPKVSIFYSEDSHNNNTWVCRKENGIIYHWDIARYEKRYLVII
jgi:hypothetical protein